MAVLIVGSIALDTIKTQTEEHADLLGGSASYAALGASFYHPVRLVGIVGRDIPKQHLELWNERQIDVEGLEIAEGKTFRWSGEYEADMNKRKTLHVELNVFETFSPTLPRSYRQTQTVLLGNISPGLQLHVLRQMEQPRFVMADTMDLWITTTRPELEQLLPEIDLLVLNESEARQLTEEDNLIRAARRILEMGPRHVLVKKGEHGCMLFSPDQFFTCGAYPLDTIKDPTGAGDTFAGGFAGYLGSLNHAEVTFDDLKRAAVHGTLLASFCVEKFSLERLRDLTTAEIEERYRNFHRMTQFD